MIANVSRIKTFGECPWKYFMRYVMCLDRPEGFPISDGKAFHEAVRIAFSFNSPDWGTGCLTALENYSKDRSDSPYLQGHMNVIGAMVDKFREAYENDPYEVVYTELPFVLDAPDSGHNCIFRHWVDGVGAHNYTAPTTAYIRNGAVCNPHVVPDESCSCWSQHRLVGTIDNVFRYNGGYAIRDYKTTAMRGKKFWEGFRLDMQLTAYLIGLSAIIGVECDTAFVDSIFRPTEEQVDSWNNQRKRGASKSIADYINVETQRFIHGRELKNQFIRNFVYACDEIEACVISGRWRQTLDRKRCCEPYMCEYLNYCADKNMHGLLNRSPDYVDLMVLEGK